jgi:hypothetical protein
MLRLFVFAAPSGGFSRRLSLLISIAPTRPDFVALEEPIRRNGDAGKAKKATSKTINAASSGGASGSTRRSHGPAQAAPAKAEWICGFGRAGQRISLLFRDRGEQV